MIQCAQMILLCPPAAIPFVEAVMNGKSPLAEGKSSSPAPQMVQKECGTLHQIKMEGLPFSFTKQLLKKVQRDFPKLSMNKIYCAVKTIKKSKKVQML